MSDTTAQAQAPGSNSPRAPPSSKLEDLNISSASNQNQEGPKIEELSDSDNEYEDMGTATDYEKANIAYLESIAIPIKDSLETDTSKIQDETLRTVLPFLEGNENDFPLNFYGLPKLQREKHIAFLKGCLGHYPAMFAAMDAARPWLLYWSLQGLTALGYDISEYRQRVVETFVPAQHPSGGYGGGYGQLPHMAATYAATLSLVMAGGSTAYESINRKTLWHFLGRMKQADGGFTMADAGEEDIRGAYCALVVMSLLNLPLDLPPDAPTRKYGMTTFLDGLGDWITRCQNWEGGISAAPNNESHGAYAFCGLGCLSLMGPPKETVNRYLDVPALIHWLSSRQCAPEGGYNGRTNKLVDGCYSHWVGGCWPIIDTVVGKSFWNRGALARYILSAAQFKKGGLIDKPGKRPDAYHSTYNLAGLSYLQRNNVWDATWKADLGTGELGAAYHWKSDGLHMQDEQKVWGIEDLVEDVHPIFVIPFQAAEDSRRYFEAKEGF